MRGPLTPISLSPSLSPPGRAADPPPLLTYAILKYAILQCAILKYAILHCAIPLLLPLVLSPSTVAAQTHIRVEFTPDGECAVSMTAGSGHASVTYPRRTTEMRCAVPTPAKAASGDVVLEVVLPAGRGRPVDAFPRLEWAERDGHWIGTGRLDGAPAFVRIAPDWGLQRWRSMALDLTVLAATIIAIVWSIARGRAS